MKWLGLLSLTIAAFASSTAAQDRFRCQPYVGGPCGDSSRPRQGNCCDSGYCQPWNSGYYQCLNKPDKCPTQETDIDYAGNDIKTIRGILPDKCCEECSNTAGCTVYTFVNQNPDGKSACYLKRSAAGRVEKKGAVSGAISTIPPPPNCPVMERGVDYFGNDIKSVNGLNWFECCDECTKTPKCVGYTYLERGSNADGRSACYLKSSTAGKVAKVGAISGKVKEDPVTTPPPPSKCSVQEIDIDYFGNDLKTVNGATQSACCEECIKTDRCIAYTFVPSSPGSKTGACYLKSATAGKVAKAGAISGVVDGSWTQPPITPPPPPADCPVQYNNVDFFGNDLKTVYALTQGGCCDECTKLPACMGYTFIAKGPDGRSACYLKSSTRGQVAKIGAVSGTPRYIKPPANCPNPELNIEYAGFDIKELKDLTYGQCCDACGKTPGCAANTFLEDKDGKSICRLKSNAVRKIGLTGAISSVYNCPTPLYGSCGSAAAGAFCCPLDGYCQPWNSKYYQCLPRPNFWKCRNLVTDVDFFGGDIDVKYGLQPADCCDACFKNMKCIAYTFVNENPDGKTACYLKDRVVEKRAKLGALSGYRAIES